MSVSIKCGPKVNGVRKESHSQCRPPVYTKGGNLVKGCPLWKECLNELKQAKVEVAVCDATPEEIANGKAFEDVNGKWKIYRAV